MGAPHSHDPVESVDQALTGSDEGMRALQVSLAVLAVTAGVELAIVLLSGSVALLGDTVHNFADALTAVPLGLAFWLGRKSPTKRYTYGYGRAEDLAGVFIVLMIAASSGLAGWEAISRLIHPRPVHHVGWVIVAGLVGFAGNELVALYRTGVGRKIGSAALVADGHHARTDGMTSLAVVVGALGVAAGWQQADPVVGLVITIVIMGVLRNAARDIFRRLMDSVDPGLVDRVTTVLEGVPGIDSVEEVRIRWIGHELRAEARVISGGNLSLEEAHAISEEGHHRLLHDVPRLADVILHTDPRSPDGRDPHAEIAHHFRPQGVC
jgi:cation diffusion facilitator family transporter